MADSTTNLDTVLSTDADKPAKVNPLFDAVSPASAFGRRASTSSALNLGLYGISRWYINATATAKANSTIALTASGTRYVGVNRSLNISQAAGAVFEADKLALYVATVGTSTISSYEDHRDPHHIVRFLFGHQTKAMSNTNQTLTYQEAMCDSIEATGALTAQRDVIVPAVPRSYFFFSNTTGGFGTRIKTPSGTGVSVADGERVIVVCDGTNVNAYGVGAGVIAQTEFTTTVSGSPSQGISAPQFLSRVPATITVLPNTGGSALVQFSTATVAAINTHYNAGAWNGTTVDWFDWVPGLVTVDSYEVLGGPVVAIRVLGFGANVTSQLVQ